MPPDQARYAGVYDGGQMELAAGLELTSDGRFRYALSYGALDEQAAGRWQADGARLLLTSDPVNAPRFVAVDARPLKARRLKVELDLPQGMDRQYFKALVVLASGGRIERQFSADGLDVVLAPGERVASIALMLSMFEIEGEPVPLAGAPGAQARFRFEPNDLGKVAFAREPLRIDGGNLVFERYDRTIVFRRQAPE